MVKPPIADRRSDAECSVNNSFCHPASRHLCCCLSFLLDGQVCCTPSIDSVIPPHATSAAASRFCCPTLPPSVPASFLLFFPLEPPIRSLISIGVLSLYQPF